MANDHHDDAHCRNLTAQQAAKQWSDIVVSAALHSRKKLHAIHILHSVFHKFHLNCGRKKRISHKKQTILNEQNGRMFTWRMNDERDEARMINDASNQHDWHEGEIEKERWRDGPPPERANLPSDPLEMLLFHHLQSVETLILGWWNILKNVWKLKWFEMIASDLKMSEKKI